MAPGSATVKIQYKVVEPGCCTMMADWVEDGSPSKPLPLVMDAIKDCSGRGGVVLDPFLGSGTTLLAAEKTGRVARAMELDPHYVDTAIRRWQALTGEAAVNAVSGVSFNEMAERQLNVQPMKETANG